jgi:hypothetical protein
MTTKYVYLAVAGVGAAILAYLCFESMANAAANTAPAVTPGGGQGVVVAGDPTIVSGTFGYALPAQIPNLKF